MTSIDLDLIAAQVPGLLEIRSYEPTRIGKASRTRYRFWSTEAATKFRNNELWRRGHLHGWWQRGCYLYPGDWSPMEIRLDCPDKRSPIV